MGIALRSLAAAGRRAGHWDHLGVARVQIGQRATAMK